MSVSAHRIVHIVFLGCTSRSKLESPSEDIRNICCPVLHSLTYWLLTVLSILASYVTNGKGHPFFVGGKSIKRIYDIVRVYCCIEFLLVCLWVRMSVRTYNSWLTILIWRNYMFLLFFRLLVFNLSFTKLTPLYGLSQIYRLLHLFHVIWVLLQF